MTRVTTTDVVAVPVRKLRTIGRRAGTALFIAVCGLVIVPVGFLLFYLYLDGRADLRDQQAAKVQQQIVQGNYDAQVRLCEALRALPSDPAVAQLLADPNFCGLVPTFGIDPDGPGPLVPATPVTPPPAVPTPSARPFLAPSAAPTPSPRRPTSAQGGSTLSVAPSAPRAPTTAAAPSAPAAPTPSAVPTTAAAPPPILTVPLPCLTVAGVVVVC